MTQYSFLEEESRRGGLKRTIFLPAIAVGGVIQYDRTHPKMSAGIRAFGYYNTLVVNNESDQNIRAELDYTLEKTHFIVANSGLVLEETFYESFNIRNMGTLAIPAGIINVVVGYEPPLVRDRRRRR